MWWLAWGAGAAQAWQAGVVTNETTRATYATVTDAVNSASPGDRLWIDGVYDEHVVIPGTKDDLVLENTDGTGELHWDGAGGSVVELQVNVTTTLRGLTITSAVNRGVQGTNGGNALTLQGGTFRANGPGSGGGVQLADPVSLTINQVTFDGATSAGSGGAVSATGTVVFPMSITDTSFLGTSASSNGGALSFSFADFTCARCTFSGTEAMGSGGAIYDGGGSTVDIEDSTFTGTSAGGQGGAIAASSSAQLTVERSSFCQESAGGGGAIAGTPVSGTIQANTFVAGTGIIDGAAIFAQGGSWTVHNNHFLENTGNATVKVSGLGTSMDLDDDLFASSSGVAVDGFGASVTVEYSDFYSNVNDMVGVTSANNLFVAPQMRAWTADGDCSNDDLRPSWNSPLVDAGDPSFPMKDPDGSRSDIGAYGGPASDPDNHVDGDGDGYVFFRDCDDGHATVHLGAAERCDTLDNDCDGSTDDDPRYFDSFYTDCDGDGQGDVDTRTDQCFAPAPVPGCAWLSFAAVDEEAWSDCDDTRSDVYFGAPETCEDGDQNCDGDPDLGASAALTYYVDGDGDGYGGAVHMSCTASPPGYIAVGGDCDDAHTVVHPGAADPCGDGYDTDCSGVDGTDHDLKDWYPDADGDGYGNLNGAITRDCTNLSLQGGFTDLDGATDCDDATADVHPGATETCNLVDDDCDGTIDDVGDAVDWYEDRDQDGYGDERFPFHDDCQPESGWIEVGGDCDDDDAAIHPEAAETCDQVDDDCDGLVDADDPNDVDTVELWPDWDQDGYGACDDGGATCGPDRLCEYEVDESWADNADDCDDGVASIHPGADEIVGDEVDQDCDGVAQVGKSKPEPDQKGCHCDSSGGPPVAGLLLPLFLVALRRRR